MSGNSIGHLFTVTTAGESHGPALVAIIDGCPAGIQLDESYIQQELNRRRPGTSRHTTQRREPDTVEVLSGVFEGITTGCPIALLIRNTDQRSKDYSDIAQLFRPGHADYTYQQKYGLRDYRGGGRSSARETAVRVAAGAIAKQALQQLFNVKIWGYMTQLGDITATHIQPEYINHNAFFWPNPDQIPDLEHYMDNLRKSGDSIGAKIRVIAEGCPPGWGEPVFDRLDADIAHALMSINAAKGVEIGDGFACVNAKGSIFRDEITPQGFLSNHAGGILGGISSGQDIVAQVAFKPTASLHLAAQTIDVNHLPQSIRTKGRHDPCVGIRATPIVESMLALVLIDHALRQRGQNAHRHISQDFLR